MPIPYSYNPDIQDHDFLVVDFTGEDFVNPSNDVIFQAILNPGHTGSIDFLAVLFGLQASGPSGTISFSLQYMAVGGSSWTTINSATLSYDGTVGRFRWFCEPTALNAPIYLRVIATGTGTWSIDLANSGAGSNDALRPLIIGEV